MPRKIGSIELFLYEPCSYSDLRAKRERNVTWEAYELYEVVEKNSKEMRVFHMRQYWRPDGVWVRKESEVTDEKRKADLVDEIPILEKEWGAKRRKLSTAELKAKYGFWQSRISADEGTEK